MTRGIAQLHLDGGTRVSAPRSGVYLGRSSVGDPVNLRLFRQAGTRIAALSALAPVQLLAMRAAAAGVTVRVMTPRPRLWQALLAHGSDAGAIPLGTEPPAATGPSLVIDDRPDEERRLGESAPWRCRIDLRTPATGQDLRTLAQADVMLIGAILPDLARAAVTSFGVVGAEVARLARATDTTVALLRRGGIDYVSLDPTPDEVRILHGSA